MSTSHRRQLTSARAKLSQSMNPKPVLLELGSTDLGSMFVLTKDDIDEITLEAIQSEQVCRLVDCLRLKPDKAFDRLMEVLNEIDRPAATIIIESEQVVAQQCETMFSIVRV